MAGKQAQGTTISRETSLGSGSYVTLANVKSFDGPSTQNAEIDVTTLSSAAKEFVGGLVDFGDLSMDVNFDQSAASHQQVFADMEASPPTVTNWRITFANPTTNYTWNAFVKGFSLGGQVDGVYSGKITLRLSSARVVS
jgi:hypothetical protein